MATRQQKQQLLEVLKHGVNQYEIHLHGYGGEIVVGTVTPEQYAYWQDKDLEELATDWDNSLQVPDSMQLYSNGSWYDLDNIAHESGVEFSSMCTATVYDENNNVVWQSHLSESDLLDNQVDPRGILYNSVTAASHNNTVHAFMAQHIEKGTFFTGNIKVLGKFDPARLSFSVIEIEGWSLVNGVSYASEIVDDTGGYSTTGKNSEHKVFEVER